MAHLIVKTSQHNSPEYIFELRSFKVSIGSGMSNDLVVQGVGIAERHAVLELHERSFSVNAVERASLWVNDHECLSAPLSHGDVIRLGDAALRFELIHSKQHDPGNTSHTLEPALFEAGYELFSNFSRKLLHGADVNKILRDLIDNILEVTEASSGYFFSVTDGVPTVEVGRKSGKRELSAHEHHFSKSILSEVIESERSVLIQDALANPELDHARSILDLSLRSVLCVPVFNAKELTGTIYLCHRTDIATFSNEHVELVSAIGQQIGLLLAHATVLRSLLDSEQRHRSLVELFPDAVLVCVEGKIEFVNPSGIEMLGALSSDEIIGKRCDRFLNEIETSFCTDSPSAGVPGCARLANVETHLLRLDNRILDVECSAVPISYRGCEAVQIICRDITERRQIVAERLRMERLITMGTVAATVAHELNNPLSYVYMNIEYALGTINSLVHTIRSAQPTDSMMLELSESLNDVYEALGSASRGSDQLRSIISSIRSYSRQENCKLSKLELSSPIEFAIKISRGEIEPRARLICDVESTLYVLANEAKLSQVFINLLFNAAHAICEGGSEDNEVRIHAFQNDKEVVVEVHDTGRGIADNRLEEIFKPFVTTKEVNDGCGLGLPISRAIVESMEGTIDVSSQLGKGSCFRVVLPRYCPIKAWRDLSSEEITERSLS